MRRNIFLTTVALALCTSFVAAQDSGEQLIKKASPRLARLTISPGPFAMQDFDAHCR